MLTAALVLLVVGAVVVGCVNGSGRPDPSFDEHTATALALLDPDNPALPARPLSFIEQVEAYLAEHAPKES